MEWDAYADESYDILCHPGITDDIYWADISQIRALSPSDIPMGDVGQSGLIAQNSFRDQNASSLQTMTWTPFQETLLPPGRNQSREHLSTSSSLTDYFSCFDSDSDEENSTERRHFDADFSNLSLCLNVSVKKGNGEPKIAITTKAEKKRPLGENGLPLKEIEDSVLIQPDESSSSLYATEFLDIQSMVNEQNDKSLMRYRLVDIPDFDLGFALNMEEEEVAPSTHHEDFVPSWCKIFQPLGEETEDAVEHHDVRSLISTYESKIKAQEVECKALPLRKEVEGQVNVTNENETETRVERNLQTNVQQRICTVTNRYEEDYSDECFQIFRKISESIIRESFEELEVESRSDIEMLGTEKVMLYDHTVKDVPGRMDQIITCKKILNIEEERINIRENNDKKIIELDPLDSRMENKITTLAIQAQMKSESQEQIKNIVYTQEQLSLPPGLVMRTRERYNEKQRVVQSSGQRTPRIVYEIAPFVSQSTSSEEDHEVEWSELGQIVPVASVFATSLRGNISSAILLPEARTSFTARAYNVDGNVQFQFEIADNIRKNTGQSISDILVTLMRDVSPNNSLIYQPGNNIQRKRLSIQDVEIPPNAKGQEKYHLAQNENEKPDIEMKMNARGKIAPKLNRVTPLGTSEEELFTPKREDFLIGNPRCNIKGKTMPMKESPINLNEEPPYYSITSLNEREEEQNKLGTKSQSQQSAEDKSKNVKSIVASFERSMYEDKKKQGFRNYKNEDRGKTIENVPEAGNKLVSHTSHKRRSKLTQDKPQPPREELSNAQNISKVLNRVEKICSGKQHVHVQQECITNKKWYGMPPDGLPSYSDGKTKEAKSTYTVLPVNMSPNAVPKVLMTHGNSDVQKMNKSRPESSKAGKSNQKNPQANDGQKSIKLQYKSKDSTVTLEYSHEKSAKRSQIPVATARQQHGNHEDECLNFQPMAKYSKLVFEDGRTVYSNAKNCCKQNNVQKMCEVFEGNDKPKVPQITYKISSSEAPMPAPKQPKLIVEEENTQYANSKSSGKSRKRFDLEKYLKKRGENIVNRGSSDPDNEAYYHVAKMLTIRVIANAKLQLSRECIEKDFAKRTATKEMQRETPLSASLSPFPPFPPPQVVQEKGNQARGGTKSHQVQPRRQYAEIPMKGNPNPSMGKADPKKNKELQNLASKACPQGEKVSKPSSRETGRRRGNRQQEVLDHNRYQLPPTLDRDQRRKRVQFDI